jgi:hypothetical protein
MKYRINFKATDFKYIEKDRKDFINKLNSKLDPMFTEIKNYFENKYKNIEDYRKGKAYYGSSNGHNMNNNSVYKYLYFSYGSINFRYNLDTEVKTFIFAPWNKYPDFKLNQEDLNFLKTFNFVPAQKQNRSFLLLDEKADDSLWENIHAKRKRIEAGSGEKMRKPYSKGAPTKEAFKQAEKTTKK